MDNALIYSLISKIEPFLQSEKWIKAQTLHAPQPICLANQKFKRKFAGDKIGME